MTPLRRGPEPTSLTSARERHLPNAEAAVGRGEVPELTGYAAEGVKEELFEAQGRKCAWCECHEKEPEYKDLDHYRPKSTYWWLAWSWENLMFSCCSCNRKYKRDAFPLVDEAMKLGARELPPGREQPLLIDPFDPTIDLRAEIQFRPEIDGGAERWKPAGRTPRGRRTIEICGLDRPWLVDDYTEHVREHVYAAVDDICRTVRESAVERGAHAQWRRLVRKLSAPRQQYLALSRDAVECLVSRRLTPVQIETYQLRWFEPEQPGGRPANR